MKSDGFTNGLNAGQEERLTVLAEECAEVIKAITKTLRHGLQSRNPDVRDSPTNQEALRKEIDDVRVAISMLEAAGDTGRTKGYLHHQGPAAPEAEQPHPR